MKTKVKTLSIGLEHFIDKIGYQSWIYQKNDDAIMYLINDISGLSRYYIEKYNACGIIVSRNPFFRIFQTFFFYIEI